jgi:hypothetical protein
MGVNLLDEKMQLQLHEYTAIADAILYYTLADILMQYFPTFYKLDGLMC